MRNIMRLSLGLVVAAALAATASAQQAGRIRGVIETADGVNLVLKLRDGSGLNVKVADDARVSALVKASLADLKNDTFIGIAGVPKPDGTIEAHSIHYLRSGLRTASPQHSSTCRRRRPINLPTYSVRNAGVVPANL